MEDEGRDPAAGALNEVAEAAETTAKEQEQVAANSRQLSRELEHGASWREISDDGKPQTILGLIGASAGRLAAVGSSFRRAVAVALAMEGLTLRQIGKQLGVSHQRISNLLQRRK